MTQGVKGTSPVCSVESCGKRARGRGWCDAHYTRWLRYGDPLIRKRFYRDDLARFWSLVDTSAGLWECWPCLGFISPDGYGMTATKFMNGRGSERVHRFAYLLFVGPIPEGLTVDHQCHNLDLTCMGGPTCQHRRCANPFHLEAVTAEENVSRGRSPLLTGLRQSGKTVCPHGHAYDEANTYVHPVTGYRWCRRCRADKMRAAAQRERSVGGVLV